jgi:hypothetical protein
VRVWVCYSHTCIFIYTTRLSVIVNAIVCLLSNSDQKLRNGVCLCSKIIDFEMSIIEAVYVCVVKSSAKLT